jgi:hypothetical protein
VTAVMLVNVIFSTCAVVGIVGLLSWSIVTQQKAAGTELRRGARGIDVA